jgi:hypothetical protein
MRRLSGTAPVGHNVLAIALGPLVIASQAAAVAVSPWEAGA